MFRRLLPDAAFYTLAQTWKPPPLISKIRLEHFGIWQKL
jgi:hypothetical protein